MAAAELRTPDDNLLLWQMRCSEVLRRQKKHQRKVQEETVSVEKSAQKILSEDETGRRKPMPWVEDVQNADD